MKIVSAYQLHFFRICRFGFFATTVKYQVALVDGTVVAETPEGGIEFHVKDGIIVVLCLFLFISLNREYNFIFHLTVFVTNYGTG